MGLMDVVRKKMQSFLQIDPPVAMMINIVEIFDFQGNAIKNRIWYRGEPNELEQLYWQIPQHVMLHENKFWCSHPTPGMEIRKIHTGLPSNIVDILAKIVSTSVNDFVFTGSEPVQTLWESIQEENKVKLDETVMLKNVQQQTGIIINMFRDPLSKSIDYSPANLVDMVEKKDEQKEEPKN